MKVDFVIGLKTSQYMFDSVVKKRKCRKLRTLVAQEKLCT